MILSFGGEERERIEVDVHGYERAPSGEYWDDNWLTVEIRVWVGGFRGKAAATIQTSELTAFAAELHSLFEKLEGVAKFTTLEGQLSLHLVGNGSGHIDLKGEVMDQAGIGNRLCFGLQFDQSRLKASIHELEEVLSNFPVR